MIKMKLKISYILIFGACFLHTATGLYSKSVYQKQIGKSEIEFELDAYYSPLDFYQPLTSSPIPYMGEKNELEIYKKLLLSPKPRFLVFELSVNPMPCLGVFAKKQFPEFYDKLYIGNDFNIIKSICAGFEEPYAASIFLGDVISFAPKDTSDTNGKGFIGILFSGGNYHIKDNVIISDNWLDSEIKFKGDKETKNQKISWSFGTGVKFHNNIYIKDVLYLSLKRNSTNYSASKLSIFKNSNFEYIFDIDAKKINFIRHYFMAGKKFPMKNKKIVFMLGAGFLWEGSDKYTGRLKRTTENKNFQILLRPNIEF